MWHVIRNHDRDRLSTRRETEEMTPREGKEQVCDLCGEAPAAVQCIGCSRMLCKKCRSMEINDNGD